MKVRMKAARSFRYATRMLSAGDEFEASRQDARVLAAIGNATEAPVAKAKPAPKVEEVEADDAEEVKPRRKRRTQADE